MQSKFVKLFNLINIYNFHRNYLLLISCYLGQDVEELGVMSDVILVLSQVSLAIKYTLQKTLLASFVARTL